MSWQLPSRPPGGFRWNVREARCFNAATLGIGTRSGAAAAWKIIKGITQAEINSTLQLELEAVRLHSARRYAALPNGHFSVTRLRSTWPQYIRERTQ
jgi:hypothetical protein